MKSPKDSMHEDPNPSGAMQTAQAASLPSLPPEALRVFAAKGREDLGDIPCDINGNGLCVRRILQSIEDLVGKPWGQIEILDLACGEGVYSIECALRGSKVRAVDARTDRMEKGALIARQLGLTQLVFELGDVRQVTVESHGAADVVLFLGILYHLDVPDVFRVLKQLCAMSSRLLVIDTHIATGGRETVEFEGRRYEGFRFREHGNRDPQELRRSRLLASIDNTFSFWFTRESLVRLLLDVGFTSVWECHAPLDAGKRYDRITLIACRGKPVQLVTYPWVNNQSEEQILSLLREEQRVLGRAPSSRPRGMGGRLRESLNAVLHAFGLELVRRR